MDLKNSNLTHLNLTQSKQPQVALTERALLLRARGAATQQMQLKRNAGAMCMTQESRRGAACPCVPLSISVSIGVRVPVSSCVHVPMCLPMAHVPPSRWVCPLYCGTEWREGSHQVARQNSLWERPSSPLQVGNTDWKGHHRLFKQLITSVGHSPQGVKRVHTVPIFTAGSCPSLSP